MQAALEFGTLVSVEDRRHLAFFSAVVTAGPIGACFEPFGREGPCHLDRSEAARAAHVVSGGGGRGPRPEGRRGAGAARRAAAHCVNRARRRRRPRPRRRGREVVHRFARARCDDARRADRVGATVSHASGKPVRPGSVPLRRIGDREERAGRRGGSSRPHRLARARPGSFAPPEGHRGLLGWRGSPRERGVLTAPGQPAPCPCALRSQPRIEGVRAGRARGPRARRRWPRPSPGRGLR